MVIPWFVGDRLALAKVRPDERWRERLPDRKRPPKYLEAFRDPARLVCYPSPATVRPGRPLVVVEGEFDALALGEALGELAAVVTLGSASAELTPAIPRPVPRRARLVHRDRMATRPGEKAAAEWRDYGRAGSSDPAAFKDWTEAKADGVNLARWWRGPASRAGVSAAMPGARWLPNCSPMKRSPQWRWGPALEDDDAWNQHALTDFRSTPRPVPG